METSTEVERAFKAKPKTRLGRPEMGAFIPKQGVLGAFWGVPRRFTDCEDSETCRDALERPQKTPEWSQTA